VCELCDQSFFSAQYFRYHRHAEHFKELGLKPYECEKCQKRLKDPFSLRYHMLSQHESKLKFKCTFCDKGFNQQSALKKHELRHTEDSQNQPYSISTMVGQSQPSIPIQTNSHENSFENVNMQNCPPPSPAATFHFTLV